MLDAYTYTYTYSVPLHILSKAKRVEKDFRIQIDKGVTEQRAAVYDTSSNICEHIV